MQPTTPIDRIAWRDGAFSHGKRVLAEETAIAITYNRTTHAVMMATPADLEDFAIGFSLSEAIVPAPEAIEEFAIIEAEGGLELRMWIPPAHMGALEKRRRRLAGATGCGMCGLESLGEALRPVPEVARGILPDPEAVQRAVAAMTDAQVLNRATRAVHAAGFWSVETGLAVLREDVGRHNALDKVGGAMARAGLQAGSGMLLLTSRISIELVQKAARMGAPVVVAISAPTALAVRTAAQAGIILIGVARQDGYEIFS